VNDNPTRSDGEEERGMNGINFGFWLAATLIGSAILDAIFAAVAALILAVPPSRLLLPYLALLDSSLVFFSLLYWALLARGRPKPYALRFSVTVFAYSQVLAVALGFSAVWLHVLSLSEVINILATCALPASVTVSGIAYVAARQMVKAPRSGSSGNAA
jgi:hypothetical protein